MNDHNREMFRRDAAMQCLLVFLDNPSNNGTKESKVSAAVEFATMLTAQLYKTEVRR